MGRAGRAVDLDATFDRFDETWSPKVVARLNDYEIKLVRLRGELVWHHHEDTDELFVVLDGRLRLRFRDGEVDVGPGQLYVVPRGVEHCPVADGDVRAMLVEPSGVRNTGNVTGALTAEHDESLSPDTAPD